MLITFFGGGIAGAAVWSAAGMVAMTGTLASGSSPLSSNLQFTSVERMRAPLSDRPARAGTLSRLLASTVQPVGTARFAAGTATPARHSDVARAAEAGPHKARLEAVVKKAAPTSKKHARVSDRSAAAKAQRLAAELGVPAPERFGQLTADATGQLPILLTYADPSPTANAAWPALLGVPPEQAQDPDLDAVDGAALPDDEDPSMAVPLPQLRPRDDQTGKPATERPATRQIEERDGDQPKKADEAKAPKQQKLGYARPNDPEEKKPRGSFGQSLRNLFGGGSKAGSGVAVYDISAAKVYMPDGSVLEAHSGIGEMADDPRYISVKMRGPTPPHTYNLKLREKRFHGVEALRMLPVDGKNRNGRDGILAHSYLLRGGRAESHGCVAFKDYDRFLRAFKQGKVKQLVVVPRGGRAANVRLASAD